jgi:phosphoglycerol transferase MdoB-like AlkP superfamily enzyme
MKNIFFNFFMTASLITLLMIACEKQETKIEIKNQSLLNEDQNFIALVTETNEFLNFLAANIKDKNLNQSDVIQQIDLLKSDHLSLENQMNQIDIIFKAPVSERLKKHLNIYKNNMSQIVKEYGHLDNAIFTKEIEQVLSTILPNQMDNDTMTFSIAGCSWKYFGCSAASTAAAILCHASCDATALATSAGLGIPACVIACGAVQAWLIVECEEKYCNSN